MSLGDHLEELRFRLIIGLAGPFVAAIVMLAFAKPIIKFICQPLYVALREAGLSGTTYAPDIMTTFSLWIHMSLIGGVVVGVPWLIWHLWQFVAPGLYPRERKFITRLIPGTAVFAFAGIAFLYYALLPLLLRFLIVFTVSFGTVSPMGTAAPAPLPEGVTLPTVPTLTADPIKPVDGQMWIKVPENDLRIEVGGKTFSSHLTVPSMVTPLITIDSYVHTVLFLALSFSLAFQMPLVMLGLAWAGIFTRKQMAGMRRYMILVNAILGAVLTGGSDPISMLVLAGALQTLYEIGLMLIRWKGPAPRPDLEDDEDAGDDGADGGGMKLLESDNADGK